MPSIPTGTVTFLFTDIEGSTKLAREHPETWETLRERHHGILRGAIDANQGYVFQIIGDAFCVAFHTAGDALRAAVKSQMDLHSEHWDDASVKVRMGIHTGKAEIQENGQYHGYLALSRIQRLMSAGHGSQVLISATTQELLLEDLPKDVSLRDLGERRLKDLIRPEHIFQLVIPGLPDTFPPLKTLELHVNNLPVQATPFVAREHETKAVRQKLLNPDVRLLTLTGPGGTGKTRLGLQVAAEALDEFPDGVFFVPLASIHEADLVASSIAQVLNIREAGNVSLMELLQEHLSKKRMLLILDNFEQVIPAAPLVNRLLSVAPKLKVLVTSREILHLYGEHHHPVAPLSVPDPEHLPSLERLTQFEAVQLFIQHAQAVKASFEVTNLNAPAVAEICHRLDGLPLAIELAAARVRLLPPENLLSRLESRLRLLTGGARDLPDRQQTLRGTIAWSYDLLNADEKTLFKRLAVFASGFTLEAAETVCNTEDLMDGVEALADKSLLKHEQGDDEPRFFMLETIHEYAAELLAKSEEANALHRSHFDYFLQFAKQACSFLEKSEQALWLNRLERAHGDLRAAILWSKQSGLVLPSAELVNALGLFWTMRGLLSEGRLRLSDALSHRAELTGSALHVQLLNHAALLARVQGDYTSASSLINESLSIARHMENVHATADALSNLGFVLLHQKKMEQAQGHYMDALELYRESNNEQGMADAFSHLGLIEFCKGNYESAHQYHTDSLAIWESLDDRQGMAWGLRHLGNTVLQQGHHYRAREFFGKSLEVSMELGSKWLVAYALEGFVSLLSTMKKSIQALCLAGFCDELRRTAYIPLSPVELDLFDQTMKSARQSLDSQQSSVAQKQGRSMSLDDAVKYARREVAFD